MNELELIKQQEHETLVPVTLKLYVRL
jgi:prefoldin subunit 5